MIVGKNSSDYIELVKQNLLILVDNPKEKKEVEYQLKQNGISKGQLISYFKHLDKLDNADIREVALIGEQLAVKFDITELQLEQWFTELEISDIHQYYKFVEVTEKVEFPIVLEDVTMVSNGAFILPISAKKIAQLYNGGALRYNPDVQRQPKFVKRQGKVTQRPMIYQKSIQEISQHLLEGTLVPTTVAYNCALGSADGVEEIVYNSKDKTLTINDGTRIDILDGMHRTLGCVNAIAKNKDIDFNFICMIFNFNTRMAQQYQSQLAKANPIPKSRVQELEASRYADTVVKMLRMDSELKGRISSRDKIGKGTNELVSYGVLANAIDTTFHMKNKLEAVEIAKYLSDYFMYLFGYFEEELSKLEEGNLMFYNKTFIGHIVLAERMLSNKVDLKNLKNILGKIDFNRNSEIWVKYDIVKDGKIGSKIEKQIEKLFKDIDIGSQ